MKGPLHLLGSSIALALVGALGCSTTTGSGSSTPSTSTNGDDAHAASAASAPAPAADWTFAVTTDASQNGVVHVEAVVGKAAAGTRLGFLSSSAKLGAFTASDDAGPIAVTRASASPNGERLDLERAPSAHGRLVYTVTLGEPSKDEDFRALAEPTDLRARGNDLFVLPEGDAPLELGLTLAVGAARSEGASSFAIGASQSIKATPHELREGTFLAGPLGHARFHAADGDDFTAWAGYTAFDGRWVGAETASVRAAVDDYVGLGPGEAKTPTSLLIIPEKRSAANASIRLEVRGLVAAVDPRAEWSAPIRLRIAQSLTQRFIGGALWVGDRAHPIDGEFFSEGFSRAIAALILGDAGILEPSDRAADVNTLLAAIDLSPIGKLPISKLESEADSREVLRVLTARGALAGLVLDHKLKAQTERPASLKSLVRTALAQAGAAHKDTIVYADFVKLVTSAAGDAAAKPILQSLTEGTELALPDNLLGKCYRFARGPIAPFELGFETDAQGDVVTVTRVTPGSNAEKAGIRSGARLKELRYEDGRSDIKVIVQPEATEGRAPKKLTFLPAGKARPGRRFERIANIPDSECR